MELSTAGTWFYMLMLVGIYTSPISIALLVTSYFKKFFRKALIGIAISLPVLATISQLAFYTSLKSERDQYNEQTRLLESTFGHRETAQILNGKLIGHYISETGVRFTHWQFELEALAPRVIDVHLPPTTMTSLAYVGLAARLDSDQHGQLLIPSRFSYTNPGQQSPTEYVTEHYPTLVALLQEDQPLIILVPNAGQGGHVIYQAADASLWRHQTALFRYEHFR